MGTKTASGGYATTLDFDIPIGDMDAAEAAIQEYGELLQQVTEESGFTLTGVARLEIEVSLEARPEGLILAHIQFFVAEKPTVDELEGDFDVGVVEIEEEMVAYTYHKGGFRDLETSFMGLGQWVFGQPLEMNGFPRIVVNLGDDEYPLEVQMPVQPE